MKSVLVPIDGSECSQRAVKYLIGALEGGRSPALHLLNVQVGITGDVSQFVSRSDIKDYRREQSDEALRPARALLDQAGIPYETHYEIGHAADCITRTAEQLQCDHVVMGTHGRSALADLLASQLNSGVSHDLAIINAAGSTFYEAVGDGEGGRRRCRSRNPGGRSSPSASSRSRTSNTPRRPC